MLPRPALRTALALRVTLFLVLLATGPASAQDPGRTGGTTRAGADAAASAPRSGNPIFDGWYADPEGAVFGDEYWVYPTFSARYEDQVFFDAFSSKDLVTWTKHEHILDTTAVKWAWRAMWAPAAVEKDGRYFLFFAANDIQSNDEPGGIGVAVSDHPGGPFTDYLGRPLIDAFHNGAQPIDQFVFRDGGDWYLFYGGWRHANVARLNDDFTGFLPFEDGTVFREITPEGYVEGPFMLERGGKYYFMWSEGGWTGDDYRVAYAVADSPLGPFERVGTILEQDRAIATGAGHHSVIRVPGTDEWYIVYHRRPIPNEGRDHRVTSIDRMVFRPDGTIEPVRMTFEGVEARPIPSGNVQRFAELGDCPLEGGEVIRDCRVGYRTLGTLNADRSNAVLFPTWFGGTSEELLEFVGPQGMIDPEKDFVILVDAFANGVSSSPSNSAAQAAFPQVTIRDMVRQQHRLLREVFGLEGLKAVVGISMGGMQAFEWAASFPGFARAIVPIVGSPRLDPYDVVLWETQLRAAEWFLACRCSEAAAVSRGVSFLSMGPDYHASASPRDSLASVLRGIAGARQEVPATWDRIVQLRAMIGHDAAAGGRLQDLARRADTPFFVVVGLKDHIVTPGPALEFARAAGSETLASESECGHAAPWCEADRVNAAVRTFLSRF